VKAKATNPELLSTSRRSESLVYGPLDHLAVIEFASRSRRSLSNEDVALAPLFVRGVYIRAEDATLRNEDRRRAQRPISIARDFIKRA